jgi:hypothetical protein
MMGTGMVSVLSSQDTIVGRSVKQRHQSAAEARDGDGNVERLSVGDSNPSRNSCSWPLKTTIILFGQYRMIDTRAQRIRFLKKFDRFASRFQIQNWGPLPPLQSTVRTPFVPFMTSFHHQLNDGERRPQ